MPTKRVLSIGQCHADHGSISHTFSRHFGVEVVAADSSDEAIALLREGPFALVLVNRILDADGSSGVDLVRQIRGEETFREVPVMLVSNYQDAQREAVEAGAQPGFGKAALGQPHMLVRMRAILSPCL